MKNIERKRNTRPADKRTRIWVLALAAVCAVCAAAYLLSRTLGSGTTAVVRVDGEVLYRIDLAAVTQAYDISIDTKYGHNTLHVAPGSIAVTAADCPDGICVAQGALTHGSVPIICMPHHLSVRIEGSGLDA